MYRLVEIMRDEYVEPDVIFIKSFWDEYDINWVQIDCKSDINTLSKYFSLRLISDDNNEVVVCSSELINEIGIDNVHMCVKYGYSTVIIFILTDTYKFMFDNMKFVETTYRLRIEDYKLVSNTLNEPFIYYSESSFRSGYALVKDFMDMIAEDKGVQVGCLGLVFDIIYKRLIGDPCENFINLYLNTDSKEFVIDTLNSYYLVYSVTDEFMTWLAKVSLLGDINIV